MQFRKVKTALIGCGMISGGYLKNLSSLDVIELVGCSDLRPERAAARAEEFGIRAMTNEEIFSDPSIELVVNTTYPLSHYTVAKEALLAGKSVYTEKMICLSLEEANELFDLAREKGLFFGGAPDTFFGAGIQFARSILDSGVLGKPVMAQAFLARSYHHERFFTGDEKRFAFCKGGGIIHDMGSYYLTALVFLFGGIKRVTGFSDTYEKNRIYEVPTGPLYGEAMTVDSDNITTGSLLFENGAQGTLTMFSESAPQNHFYIYCTDGYLDLGDPNLYGRTIRMVNKRGEESILQSPFGIYDNDFRGYGAAEAMYARMAGRRARCDGSLCRHVLEATLGILESNRSGRTYEMTTKVERPEPFKTGYTEGYTELVLK